MYFYAAMKGFNGWENFLCMCGGLTIQVDLSAYMQNAVSKHKYQVKLFRYIKKIVYDIIVELYVINRLKIFYKFVFHIIIERFIQILG